MKMKQFLVVAAAVCVAALSITLAVIVNITVSSFATAAEYVV